MISNTLFHGDSSVTLKRVARESVDLVLTSCPYDNLRSYGGVGNGWNFETFKAIAVQTARVLKPHGVLVWNVNDQCIGGGYTCTSMRQVLYFTDVLGLKLHDVMVWQKPNSMPRKRGKRYQASFELMYVFSKGEPKTFHPIMRVCKYGGRAYKSTYKSNLYEGRVEYKEGVVPSETVDSNVWVIPTASASETNYTLSNGRKIHHTAVFPKELALRHIRTWTNEGDTVLDPFMGSGTSGLAAIELGRSFIGCELNNDYYQMASERIAERMSELGHNDCEKASKVSDEDILTPKHLVKVKVGKKHVNLFAQRVEQSVYDKLHLSDLHYIKDPINKGATCLLFTDMKGRNVAFVGLLNNPSRSYPNAVIVSRIIVFPQFQHRGFSVPILDKVGAMLAARGQKLFINTEDKRFGKRLDYALCWKGTTYDKKERKYYQHDSTHHNRKGGIMRRKIYVGASIYGYSELFEKVSVLRQRKANDKEAYLQRPTSIPHRTILNRRGSKLAVVQNSTFFVEHCANIVSLGIAELLDRMVKAREYVLMDTRQQEDIKMRKYNYFDTS